jgi:hypothetical protein
MEGFVSAEDTDGPRAKGIDHGGALHGIEQHNNAHVRVRSSQFTRHIESGPMSILERSDKRNARCFLAEDRSNSGLVGSAADYFHPVAAPAQGGSHQLGTHLTSLDDQNRGKSLPVWL